MNFLSKFYSPHKENSQETLNTNYKKKSRIKNIIRLIDMLIRYIMEIRKARKKKENVILFDRYFYDILLQSKKDSISSLIMKFFPKPDKLFFLDASPEDIFERKGERNIEILKEQSDKFKKEINSFCKIDLIETKSEIQTKEDILIKLNNKDFLKCL